MAINPTSNNIKGFIADVIMENIPFVLASVVLVADVFTLEANTKPPNIINIIPAHNENVWNVELEEYTYIRIDGTNTIAKKNNARMGESVVKKCLMGSITYVLIVVGVMCASMLPIIDTNDNSVVLIDDIILVLPETILINNPINIIAPNIIATIAFVVNPILYI